MWCDVQNREKWAHCFGQINSFKWFWTNCAVLFIALEIIDWPWSVIGDVNVFRMDSHGARARATQRNKNCALMMQICKQNSMHRGKTAFFDQIRKKKTTQNLLNYLWRKTYRLPESCLDIGSSFELNRFSRVAFEILQIVSRSLCGRTLAIFHLFFLYFAKMQTIPQQSRAQKDRLRGG